MPHSLKRANLLQLHPPRCLVVLHYGGNRISIPLSAPVDNLTEYLWHQLYRFHKQVLAAGHGKGQDSHDIDQIVCFRSYQQVDLRMSVLLAMARLAGGYDTRGDVRVLDLGYFYDWMEVEPVHGGGSPGRYRLCSVLGTGHHYTKYLGCRTSDGRYFTIKVAQSESALAQNQFHYMRVLLRQQEQFDNKRQLQLIPQIQQVRQTESLFIYVYEYCPGGTLRQYSRQQPTTETQCLSYLKQLIWGVHTLHANFNIMHRGVSLDNLQVDFVGNLRLVNYAYSQDCYASSYLVDSAVAQAYQQRYEISGVLMPPEVGGIGGYNNMVDYFGVGHVLHELMAVGGRWQGARDGIMEAIHNLMQENVKQRQDYANELIVELHSQKMGQFKGGSRINEPRQLERLTLNQINTGCPLKKEECTSPQFQEVIKLLGAENKKTAQGKSPIPRQLTQTNFDGKNRNSIKGKQAKQQKRNSGNKSISKQKSRKKGQPSKFTPASHVKLCDKSMSKSAFKNSEKSHSKSMESKNNSAKTGYSSNKKLHKPPQYVQKFSIHSPPIPKDRSNAKSPTKHYISLGRQQQPFGVKYKY